MTTKTRVPVKRGAAAHAGTGAVPPLFPRTIAPNAHKYVQRVLDSGITEDTVVRFEKAFAEELGRFTALSFPVIGLPTTLLMGWVLRDLLLAMEKHTDQPVDTWMS